MDNILSDMSVLISGNIWIAPVIAFLAGILTSFSPCSLSSIPLIIGYVGGYNVEDTKKSFKLSIFFAIGMAITFTALGTIASLLGKYIRGGGSLWYIFLGVVMVLMALQTYEVFTFIRPTTFQNRNKKKGYLGAFLMGILGGFFSSPCSTPVLIVLLALVANSNGNILWGAFLLLLYSIGNSFLVVALGTSTGLVKKIKNSQKYNKVYNISKYILGTIILFIGFYMFYLGF